jgi:hypothetical protein
MNNTEHDAYWMATLYGNALVLVGFHIDFCTCTISGTTGKEENNLIKKKKSYGILFQ